ncbi:MAG TPA: sigma 54-interacting transcriptional regulator [Thermoanaerobaculia bacterium]|nr:sigma 54-interacting transcriptional regulator [Thermoanaerobaculia bacterium]
MQDIAAAIGSLVYQNPFLPQRIETEHAILGDDFVADTSVWSRDLRHQSRPNIAAIGARAEHLVKKSPRGPHYEDLATYVLYDRWSERFLDLADGKGRERVGFYDDFAADARHLLTDTRELPHLFACFYQVRRAFLNVFEYLVGTSMCAAQLRADVWCSIFSRDLRRYRRSLFARMNDVTTLIIGPTGTGKELVARAIALSRYIPFDERTRKFAAAPDALFAGLNLSAMSPSLIESELFGHRKGAFTGALNDREGWLEACSAHGSVFLDEVGELDPSIQVKLLRVLQTRTFQRLGDTTTRHFAGKIIAATNRDLATADDFRRDFYYRLCADVITTPSLREQLDDNPHELRHLVTHIATNIAGAPEAEVVSDEVMRVVQKKLGAQYPWPGNYRELEQCVRRIVIRGDYEPSLMKPKEPAALDGQMTEEQLLRWYTNLVYRQTGSYQETARRLGIDRRTARARCTTSS